MSGDPDAIGRARIMLVRLWDWVATAGPRDPDPAEVDGGAESGA